MSEPNSLFAQIHITKENFDKFLKAKPTAATLDDDLQEWWNSREMVGKKALQKEDLYCYNQSTNESIINNWKDEKGSATFSDYYTDNEIWHFGIIMFSENYSEMIPALAFMKSLGEFKNESKEDFCIIYNYVWGDEDVSAFINYENQKGLLDNKIKIKAEVNTKAMKIAEDILTMKYEEFAKQYED